MDAVVRVDWCEITKVGVRFTGAPTFQELQATFQTWQDINRLSAWAIGDLLNYAETRYGETYAQLMDETGLSYGRLANLKSLSAAVPLSRRREHLSLSHHSSVAFLRDDSEEQERLLDLAVERGMNREEFRECVREYKVASLSLEKPDQGAVGQSVEPPARSLHGVVVDYVRAIRNGNKEQEREMFNLMYSLVEKEL